MLKRLDEVLSAARKLLEDCPPGLSLDMAQIRRQFAVIDFEALLLRQPTSEAAMRVKDTQNKVSSTYSFVSIAEG